MLLTWILLTTLAVAIIPTGEAGIQALTKVLLSHDQLEKEFREKVSYDIQWCTFVNDCTLFLITRLIALPALQRRILANIVTIVLLE